MMLHGHMLYAQTGKTKPVIGGQNIVGLPNSSEKSTVVVSWVPLGPGMVWRTIWMLLCMEGNRIRDTQNVHHTPKSCSQICWHTHRLSTYTHSDQQPHEIISFGLIKINIYKPLVQNNLSLNSRWKEKNPLNIKEDNRFYFASVFIHNFGNRAGSVSIGKMQRFARKCFEIANKSVFNNIFT